MRRTMASGCRRLGVDRDVVETHARAVGGPIGVYQHYDIAAERRAAVELWSRHVKALVV